MRGLAVFAEASLASPAKPFWRSRDLRIHLQKRRLLLSDGLPGQARPRRNSPAQLRQQGVRDLEICEYVLNVVVLVEKVDQLQQLFAGLVVDGNRVLRLPGQRCLAR